MTNFEGKNSLVASCQCKCNPLPSGPLFIMHNILPKYNIGHPKSWHLSNILILKVEMKQVNNFDHDSREKNLSFPFYIYII
jgi:hypothetical protein